MQRGWVIITSPVDPQTQDPVNTRLIGQGVVFLVAEEELERDWGRAAAAGERDIVKGPVAVCALGCGQGDRVAGCAELEGDGAAGGGDIGGGVSGVEFSLGGGAEGAI